MAPPPGEGATGIGGQTIVPEKEKRTRQTAAVKAKLAGEGVAQAQPAGQAGGSLFSPSIQTALNGAAPGQGFNAAPAEDDPEAAILAQLEAVRAAKAAKAAAEAEALERLRKAAEAAPTAAAYAANARVETGIDYERLANAIIDGLVARLCR
jgi:hypothetical protein